MKRQDLRIPRNLPRHWKPSRDSIARSSPPKSSAAARAAKSTWKALKQLGITRLAVGVLLVIVLYQATKPVVIIEKIDIDPSIKDHLLSSDELTQETQASVVELPGKSSIRFGSVLLVGKGERPEVTNEPSTAFRSSDRQSIDFQVPTVGLSYLTIQNIIRGIVGNQPTLVHVVISKNDESEFGFGDDDAKGENAHIRGEVSFENAKLPLDNFSSSFLVSDSKEQRSKLTRDTAIAHILHPRSYF